MLCKKHSIFFAFNILYSVKMKKAIFIADAHLKSPNEPCYRDLCNFFDRIVEKGDINALFILGDLFDFFVGFPKIIFYEHIEIIYKLELIAQKGVSIFYFEGNHDFFLKKLNKLGFPVHIIEKSMDLLIQDRYLLSHGDRIDQKDYAHRFLSFIVKNPITNLFSYLLPPYLVYDFAHYFSKFSRKNISSKRQFKETIFTHFAKNCVKNGYKGAILGHFHKSTKITLGSFNIYLVGSWKENRDYLVCENDNFYFQNYND